MKIGLPLLVLGCLAVGCSAAIDNEEGAMAYMKQYGYIKSSEMTGGFAKTLELKQKAIRFFQRFFNLTINGNLDEKTMEMMNMPRCGMPDIESEERDMVRRKRYALGTKWDKTDLTWRINSRTPDLTVSQVDRIMAEALKVWSDVSTLTFRRVTSGDADIIIDFYPGQLDHGDRLPFDGPGGVLAHAYFPTRDPIGGDAHFDDEETYTDGVNRDINLFQVAAHEFGHSLGLRHSQETGALMAPYYAGYIPNFQLPSDDIAGIQAHYGQNVGQPEGMATQTTPVENCMTQISMVMQTRDGSTYLVNGTHVFRRNGNSISSGYPRPISSVFPGLPSNPDAGFYYSETGKTYVFKGNQYWRLTNQVVDSGFPQPIHVSSDFRGLPSDLSSAFVWSGNGRIYFTKGSQYYRITVGSGVDAGYPRPLSTWRGLPSTIDAAFQYTNARTYFFSGPNYFRFDDRSFNIDAGYPRNTAVVWLGCDPAALGLAPSTPNPSGDAAMTVPSFVGILFSAFLALLYSS